LLILVGIYVRLVASHNWYNLHKALYH